MIITPVTKVCSLVIVMLLAFNTVFAKPADAVIINSSSKDRVSLHYKNIFIENKNHILAPGGSVRVSFDQHSFTPVIISFTVSPGLSKPVVFAVLPGDTIHIKLDKASNNFELTGSNLAELSFYKKLWHSNIGLHAPYLEMLPAAMPASLEDFMSKWLKLKQESNDLVEELNAIGVRPVMKDFLTMEFKLRLFSILNLPSIYNSKKQPVNIFPQFYRDSVVAQASLLHNLQELYPVSSERLLYAQRGFILFKAIEQGQKPAFKIQYELAKKEYSGLQREWVCYSILKDARSSHEDISPLLKDFQSWVSPESVFLRRLKGEVNPVVLDKTFTSKDVLLNVAEEPVLLSDLLARHKGKVIYIDFWASWCAPCIMEFPASEKIREAYINQDLVMLYLSVDKDAQNWQKATEKFLKQATDQYRFEDEAKSAFINRFDIKRVPRYMLIDRNGDVFHADAPRPDDPILRVIVNKLLLK